MLGAPSLHGGGREGGTHADQEWYEETADSYRGVQRAALIAAALAGVK